MDIKNQVVSLELAKRLKELGVPQTAEFSWFDSIDYDDIPRLNWTDERRSDIGRQAWERNYAAFIAEELVSWAKPDAIYRNVNGQGKWMASIPSVEGYGETMAEAIGNLLVKRIQDGLDPKTL